MPLYKRLPLQRRMLERRSLRLPSHPMKSMVPSHLPPNKLSIAEGQELRFHTGSGTHKGKVNKSSSSKSSNPVTSKLQTPLDLELDLAAQQSKLKILQDEIDRLKVIKNKMEDAKSKGNKEIPDWLQEDEPFQELLTKVKFIPNGLEMIGSSIVLCETIKVHINQCKKSVYPIYSFTPKAMVPLVNLTRKEELRR